mmetsp:Transcript_23275/g.42383  ORF Transcript_23275/g.42383 Transcript_23275/m.42383 type:complete len:219 (+) Transcript_23275:290-946(+)
MLLLALLLHCIQLRSQFCAHLLESRKPWLVLYELDHARVLHLAQKFAPLHQFLWIHRLLLVAHLCTHCRQVGSPSICSVSTLPLKLLACVSHGKAASRLSLLFLCSHEMANLLGRLALNQGAHLRCSVNQRLPLIHLAAFLHLLEFSTSLSHQICRLFLQHSSALCSSILHCCLQLFTAFIMHGVAQGQCLFVPLLLLKPFNLPVVLSLKNACAAHCH